MTAKTDPFTLWTGNIAELSAKVWPLGKGKRPQCTLADVEAYRAYIVRGRLHGVISPDLCDAALDACQLTETWIRRGYPRETRAERTVRASRPWASVFGKRMEL